MEIECLMVKHWADFYRSLSLKGKSEGCFSSYDVCLINPDRTREVVNTRGSSFSFSKDTDDPLSSVLFLDAYSRFTSVPFHNWWKENTLLHSMHLVWTVKFVCLSVCLYSLIIYSYGFWSGWHMHKNYFKMSSSWIFHHLSSKVETTNFTAVLHKLYSVLF